MPPHVVVLVLHVDTALAAVCHGGGAVEIALVAERIVAEHAEPVWFCTANSGQMHVTVLVFVGILQTSPVADT